MVKFGALIFVLEMQSTYAIQLQLLGGIWMCQTLPAVMIALYTRFFHPVALLAGWAAGLISGTWHGLASLGFRSSSTFRDPWIPGPAPSLTYAALSALALNLVVSHGADPGVNAGQGPHNDVQTQKITSRRIMSTSRARHTVTTQIKAA